MLRFWDNVQMSTLPPSADIPTLIADMGSAARAASGPMAAARSASKNAALRALARLLRQPNPELQQANQRDVQAAQAAGLAAPMVDRLRLSDHILSTLAEGCDQIAAMPDPIG